MVGGPEAAFERVKPLFAAMGKNITLVGGNGDGQTTKVANQIIVALNIEAVAEALLFASKAGADPAKVRQALMGGFAASRILEVHGERMVKRTFNPGFRIELHQKDLNLALQGAKELGVSLPHTASAAQLMQSCAAHGMAGLDHSALCRGLELMANHPMPPTRPPEVQHRARERVGVRLGHLSTLAPCPPPPPSLTTRAPCCATCTTWRCSARCRCTTRRAFLPPPPKGRTLVLGAGKAGGAMAQAVEALWPADAPLSGLVVTRYHHMPPRPGPAGAHRGGRGLAPGARRGRPAQAAQRILRAHRRPRRPTTSCCASSPAAARPCSRCPATASRSKTSSASTASCCDSGATHRRDEHRAQAPLGDQGRAARGGCAPARVVTLTISDVPGDDVSVIASGPTVADASTCAEALDILRRYGIDVPPAVRAQLESGALRNAQARRPAPARARESH